LKVSTTDRVDPAAWDEFVEAHPLGSIFHHSLWHQVIRKTYGYQPLYHIIADRSSGLRAGVCSVFVKSRLTGKRIVSYPFSDYCDPLVNDEAELDLLFDALERSRAELGARFFELRCFRSPGRAIDSQAEPEYYSHQLSLDRGLGAIFRSFHKSSIQRAIKKARRVDIEISAGEDHEDLKAFYRLHLMTRRRQGVSIQPFRFFKNVWDGLHPKGMVSLLLARHRGEFVSGIIMGWFKDVAYFKFGASDDRLAHLRANQLLMWEAIRLAQERGCKRFDFGRTGVANKGLMQYKSRWGTEQSPLSYLRLPLDQESGFLKDASTRSLILKKSMMLMPSFGVRLTGELFYKHFA